MKIFEVRFVEVYRVEAETEDEAYDLASRSHSDDETLDSDDMARIDYLHGDDTVNEI